MESNGEMLRQEGVVRVELVVQRPVLYRAAAVLWWLWKVKVKVNNKGTEDLTTPASKVGRLT
jgi:hypothetical protein